MMLWFSCKRFVIKHSLCVLILIFTFIILSYSYLTNISRSCSKLSFNYTSKYPYLALIVDNRATPLLMNAVHNVLKHIPIDWKVQIITPYNHWSYYNKSSLGQLIKTNRIFFTPLERSSNGLSDGEYINSILTSASFWHEVQGEKVLLFQIDAVLCSNSLYNLTDFLQYDFIGAPWSVGGCCNGGLSLRSRTKTLQLLESGYTYYSWSSGNEDGWFTKNLPYCNAHVAPVSIAKKFAVETIYHPRPFAVHKPLINYLGLKHMTLLCNECPELRTIGSYCQSSMNIGN